MNWFINIVFILLYIFITFFGIGPILFADGTHFERIITLVIVIFMYLIITSLFIWIKKELKS